MAMLDLCVETVDDYVSRDGDGGCFVAEHDGAMTHTLRMEYGD